MGSFKHLEEFYKEKLDVRVTAEVAEVMKLPALFSIADQLCRIANSLEKIEGLLKVK